MSERLRILRALTMLLLAVLALAKLAERQAQGQESQDQFFFRDVRAGVKAGGQYALQVGLLNAISAAVASNTTTQVIAAPSAGGIYLRGIWVEKMTTGTGFWNVISGTGSNCVTGTATLFSQSAASGQPPQLGEFNMNIRVPVGTAVCLQTDGPTTSVRALYN